MTSLKLIRHAPGAPGLRLLGLGPNLLPSRGLLKLQRLLDKHAFWARNRSYKSLRKLLRKSSVVITIWRDKRIVGFGRATSDGIYRAVLWDIVVAGDLQGQGLGRKVVEALLSSPSIKKAERVYLMTTNSKEFYEQVGFHESSMQSLLIKNP
ncbi:GNAT family N-acetyltransferase [Prochlorococcus marinus]|nr:GNAT family N-acetyltransferase [Prochlorococcus marinus]